MNNRGKKILALLIVLGIISNLLPVDFRVKADEAESYTHEIICDENCEVVDEEGNVLNEITVSTEEKNYKIIVKPKDKDYTISSVHLTDAEETEPTDISLSDTDISYVCTVANIEDTDIIVGCEEIPEVPTSDYEKYIQVTGMGDTIIGRSKDNSIWYSQEGSVLLTPVSGVERVGVYSEEDSKYVLDEQYILSGDLSIDKIYFEDSDGKLNVCNLSIRPVGEFSIDATNTTLTDEVTVKSTLSVNEDNLKFTGEVGLDYVRYSTNEEEYNNSVYDNTASDIIAVNDGEFSFELSEGTYYIWAYNKLGEKSVTYKKVTVQLDTEAPKITSLKISEFYKGQPQGDWNDISTIYSSGNNWGMWINNSMINTNMAIGMNFDEEVVGISYSLDLDSGYSDLDGKKYKGLYWVPLREGNFTGLDKVYYIKLIDKYGNEAIRTINVNKDIEGPKITDSNIQDIKDKGWTNVYPVITFEVDDQTSDKSLASGVKSIKWSVEDDIESGESIEADSDGQYKINTKDIEGSANGLNTSVYIWVVDEANNITEEKVSIKVDSKAPTISSIKVVNNSNIVIPYNLIKEKSFWYNMGAQLEVCVSDIGISSGIKLQYQFNDGNQTEITSSSKDSVYEYKIPLDYNLLIKGDNICSILAYDIAGNKSEIINYNMKEDAEAPLIDIGIEGYNDDSNNYIKGDKDVIISVKDSKSGLASVTCCYKDNEGNDITQDITDKGMIKFESKDYLENPSMQVKVTATDKLGNKYNKTYNWTWDMEEPNVEFKATNGKIIENYKNEYILVGNENGLCIKATDNKSGVKCVKVTKEGKTHEYSPTEDIVLNYKNGDDEYIDVKVIDNVGNEYAQKIHVECCIEEKIEPEVKIEYNGKILGDEYLNGENVKLTIISPKADMKWAKWNVNNNNIKREGNFTLSSDKEATSIVNIKGYNGKVEIDIEIELYDEKIDKKKVKAYLNVDNAAPIINKNNKTCYKTGENIELSITDEESGVKEARYSLDPSAYDNDKLSYDQEQVYSATNATKEGYYLINLSEKEEQELTYYIWAYDKLGNKSTMFTKQIEIDNTSPIINSADIYVGNEKIKDNWTNESVDVVLDINNSNFKGENNGNLFVFFVDLETKETKQIDKKDNKYKITINKIEEQIINKEYEFYAIDEAGNKSAIYTKTIRIDDIDPQINIKNKDIYDGKWQQSDYDILLDVSDDASGLKKVTWSKDKDGKEQHDISDMVDDCYSINTAKLVDNSSLGIDGEYYFFVYDNAGNVSKEKLNVKIDRTNPKVLTIETAGRYENGYLFNNANPIIEVKTEDNNVSSGIKEVKLYRDKETIPLTVVPQNGKCILLLEAGVPRSGDFYIEAIDNSGRSSIGDVSYDKGAYQVKYMLEDSKPKVNITFDKFISKEDIIYFNSDEVKISAEDDEANLKSGIKLVDYSVWVNDNKLYGDSKVNNEPFKNIQTSFSLNEKGINTCRTNKGYDNVAVKFSNVEDYATNSITDETYSYRYDDYAPYMVEANIIKGSKSNEIEQNDGTIKYTDTYSYNSDIKMTFKATDDNGCGVDKFQYYLEDSTGKKVYEGECAADKNDSFTITDEFKEDFKGSIYVRIIDNLGNASKYYCYGGIIVEHNGKDNIKGDISLVGDNKKIIIDGRSVYNSDTDVSFKFSNSFAGIKTLDFKIIDSKNNKVIYKDNKDYQGSEEEQLFKYTLKHEGTIDIIFTLTDRCNNKKEFTQNIIVDKCKPQIDTSSIDTISYYKKGDVISVSASDVDGNKKSDNQTGISFLRYGYSEEDYNNDNYFSDGIKIEESDDEGVYNIIVDNDKSESKVYYIWAYDYAGNKSEACVVTINIDNTKPEIKKIDKGYEGEWTNKQVELSVYIDEQGGSNLNRVEYSEDKSDYDSDSKDIKKATCVKDDNIYQYNIVIDDNRDYVKTIYVWSYDNAGNKSECSEIEIKHDETLPTVDSIEVMPTKDWVNYSRTITIKVSDNSSKDGINSGIKDIICTNDITGETYYFDKNITRVQDGVYEVVVPEKDGITQSFNSQYYIWAIDEADNKSNCSDTTIKTDVGRPVISDIRVIPTDRNLEKNYIRFLNFGTFSKSSVDIVVSVDDGEISSGINDVYLIGDKGSIEKSSIVESDMTTATFTLNKRTYNNLRVYAIDKADNQSDEIYIYEKDTDVKGKLGNNYMIEDTAPTIEVTAEQDECIDNQSRSWVRGTEKYNIAIEDNESGINKLVIKVNDEEEIHDYIKNSSLTKTIKDTVELALDKYKVPEDNIYNVTITVEDNAGNITTKDMKFYRDVVAPEVVDIKIEPLNNNYLNNSIFEYGFFANNNRTIRVYSDDGDFSCGLKSITYYLVDYTNMQTGVASIKKTVKLSDKQAGFDIPTDFKGKICVVATDNLGNEKEVYSDSKGIILESESRHQKTSSISFNKEGTSKRDIDGRELYNKDIDLTFSVEDNYSGIKEIRWSVESPYDISSNQSEVISVNNGIVSDRSSSCVKKRSDKNIVNEIQKTIRVSNNSDNIKVKVQLVDNAGNTTTKEINFSIDKINPTVEVSYDNNNYNSEDGTSYYNANRIATIIVTERNFDSSRIDSIIENTHGLVPSIGQWNLIADNSDPDKNRYVATIVYSEDGDYTFDIGCKDLAGNASNDYAVDRFTIDKTIPTIQVSYNNNNGTNGNYYNQDRVATITINEHNFNPNNVVINGNGMEQGANVVYPTTSNWSTSGDTHTATITYSQDGLYTLDVDYKDKAGNAAQDIQQDSFYIDKTKPEVKISDIDNGSSNNNVVMPRVTYTDNNFDANNVSITLTGSLKGNVDIKGAYSDVANGQSFVFADFDKLQEVDDIYTLNAKVIDKAGNEAEDNIMFTVNRFGSVYLFDSGLKTMIGKYMNSNEDIKLTEMNADDIDLSKVKVKLSKNGITNDLVRGKDFTVEKSGGNGQWSKLDYTVKSSSFEEDGKYILTFISVDNAGNTNENIDETKGAEIWFGVDKTAPVVVPIGIESGKTYPVDNKEATLSVSDNLVLSNVKVYLNDKLVKCNVNGDNYSFDISAKNTSQNIKVVATDEAGNKLVQEVKNFYVTTNLFVRFYANKPLFIATIAGAALLITGITIFSFYRKKKKMAENNN